MAHTMASSCLNNVTRLKQSHLLATVGGMGAALGIATAMRGVAIDFRCHLSKSSSLVSFGPGVRAYLYLQRIRNNYLNPQNGRLHRLIDRCCFGHFGGTGKVLWTPE